VLIDKIFSMQKPQAGKASFDNVILPDGNYVLAGLNSVTEGEVKVDSVLQAGFAREVGSREQQAMLKALREQADVSLFLENIQ
jgi:peptidyl-prolyl cis-trans isomerase D